MENQCFPVCPSSKGIRAGCEFVTCPQGGELPLKYRAVRNDYSSAIDLHCWQGKKPKRRKIKINERCTEAKLVNRECRPHSYREILIASSLGDHWSQLPLTEIVSSLGQGPFLWSVFVQCLARWGPGPLLGLRGTIVTQNKSFRLLHLFESAAPV